jgi:hypothetical protein
VFGAEEVKPKSLGLIEWDGTLFSAAKADCEFSGMDIEGSTAAVEGFRKVGEARMEREGAGMLFMKLR